jgi:enolase
MSTKIQNILSRMILDSRGFPTIEVEIILDNGISATACVPSGASTGDKEALELRDQQTSNWHGKGVDNAINNINTILKPKLLGLSPLDTKKIDELMIKLDGTEHKSKIGANAILAVSLACIRAAASQKNQTLFHYIFNYSYKKDLLHCPQLTMPAPMMNILNGGSHADNNVDIQEFMIMPVGFKSYSIALKAGMEIFHTLKKLLKKINYSTAIGDEGGFAPMLESNEEALQLIAKAIDQSGYKLGDEIVLALDVAASELYDKNKKTYYLNNKEYSSFELIEYYQKLCAKYPIVSIEDGLDQNDWKHWNILNMILGDTVQIVGDDLTVTNTKLLQKAINQKSMNAILIKLNQIGTVSETIDAIKLAQNNNLGVIISHRSGETEDTFIADLAVATNAGQIKTGSLCRTDRTAKYNQLLRIEEILKNNVVYAQDNFIKYEKK